MSDNKTTEVTAKVQAEIIERLVIGGDLSSLQPAQKVAYYNAVCESLGLNPLTKPFDVLRLNGKEVLYAKRDATDQLRKLHGVSVTDLETTKISDVYVVIAKGRDRDGRTDAATGAVPISGLKSDFLANAMMKAETKAKRRLTLSLCGLGILDESEIDSIPRDTQQTTRTVTGPAPSNDEQQQRPAADPVPKRNGHNRPPDQWEVIEEIGRIVGERKLTEDQLGVVRAQIHEAKTLEALVQVKEALPAGPEPTPEAAKTAPVAVETHAPRDQGEAVQQNLISITLAPDAE